MKLFKRNKTNNKQDENTVGDKMAKGIAGFLVSIQIRFASFMDVWTNHLSKNAKRIWLIVFCMVFGGFSIYAFMGAFKSHRSSDHRIKPAQLSVPRYYDQKEMQNEQTVSKKDMLRIDRFKKYMDSLRRSEKGKAVHDSILKARPGLMDSIQAIEQLYYSQSK